MKLTLCLILLGVATALASPRRSGSFRQPPERIVGGVNATRGEFPWIVQLRYGNGHMCGGFIVNANWIATAAHCAVYNTGLYSIVAGEHNLNVNEGSEQVRNVSRIVLHPRYDDYWLTNDIALMRVGSPFTTNLYVRPATLPASNTTVSGNVTAAGWGTTSESGSVSTTLLKVTVPIVPRDVCNSNYQGEILDGMICAGTGGKDSCQGDSGGPLHGSGGSVVGIVSWGYGCARPGYPGVYSDVSYFANWISQNIAV